MRDEPQADGLQAYGLAARLSIGLAGFLFGATIAALFLVDVQLRYNAALDAAEKDTLNYAEMLAEHTAPTYRSATRGQWLSAVSRRLNNPDGSFAGIVPAPIDQSYFNKFYRTVDLGASGSILLLHREGPILAREPMVAGAIGKSLSDS